VINVWIALSWIALCATASGAFLIGRAFARHEVEDLHTRNMMLDAALQRETIDRRHADKQCQELRAALHHKSILRNAITEAA